MLPSTFHSVNLLSDEFLAQFEHSRQETVVPVVVPVLTKEQKRCPTCRNRLLLSDTACRCGLRHCGKHRLPEEHACTFDHAGLSKDHLKAAVVACVADKISDRC